LVPGAAIERGVTMRCIQVPVSPAPKPTAFRYKVEVPAIASAAKQMGDGKQGKCDGRAESREQRAEGMRA
jgi:hypothetical protein